MKDLQLKSHRFRAEREGDWRRLESLLGKAESARIRGLTDAELLEIPVLYRAACSSLSVARATSLDASLIAYLESLATRGYFFVYGPRTRLLERITGFFRYSWPGAIKGIWRETLVSGGIFIVATVVAYFMVLQDTTWYDSMVGGMAQGRDFTASTDELRKVLYNDEGGKGLGAFAVWLFQHNAQVSIMCFALGFAFCVPTALFIAEQGIVLGAMLALYSSRGLGLNLAGWLLIHGVTELFAMTLAGAAGFRIGWAVAFPGEKSRVDAAAAAGKQAGVVMIGVVIMLIVAGLLEGIGRQTIRVDWQRFAIAGFTLTLWLSYFYLPRRREAAV
jgi:uncharacterized membrane protein SpoIIM required for sporulation